MIWFSKLTRLLAAAGCSLALGAAPPVAQAASPSPPQQSLLPGGGAQLSPEQMALVLTCSARVLDLSPENLQNFLGVFGEARLRRDGGNVHLEATAPNITVQGLYVAAPSGGVPLFRRLRLSLPGDYFRSSRLDQRLGPRKPGPLGAG